MDDTSLSPGAAVIVAAARERDIPVQRLSEDLFQLGQGARQHRFRGAETEATAAIAKTIAHDKEMARALMQSVGVPVVYGRAVNDADDAWAAAQEMGLPAIVKPQYTGYGWTSAANLNSRKGVVAAYEVLRKETGYIIVEHSAPGDKYRLLVVGGRVIMACRCDAPSINDAPTMTDVTPQVDVSTLDRATDAALVVGLDMGAVGVIATDIARPLEEQDGIVFGIQPAPDLTPYVKAAADGGLAMGRAIVAARFPEGQSGRIPLVAIRGDDATATAWLIADVLQAAGHTVGLATAAGHFVDGRQITDRDSRSPQAAAAVLMSPLVDAAVLEVAGAKATDWGFDRCDVAVLAGDGVANLVKDIGAVESCDVWRSVDGNYSVLTHGTAKASFSTAEFKSLPQTARVFASAAACRSLGISADVIRAALLVATTR